MTPSPENEFEDETPTVIERIQHDLKKLAKIAAKYGFIFAIICHFLPPHYRPLCDAVKACLP